MNKALKFGNPEFTLVSYLFREYLVEHDLDTKQAETVVVEQFYDWVKYRIDVYGQLFTDKEELENHDFSDEDFAKVEELFETPFSACAHLYSWWPALTLAGRSQDDSQVQAVAMTITVAFTDGALLHIPLSTSPEPENQGAYSDGIILTLFRGQLSLVGELVKRYGMGGLKEKAALVDDNVVYMKDLMGDKTEE